MLFSKLTQAGWLSPLTTAGATGWKGRVTIGAGEIPGSSHSSPILRHIFRCWTYCLCEVKQS